MVCQVWQDCEGLSLWVSDLTSTIYAAPEKKRGPAILPKNGKDQAAATLRNASLRCPLARRPQVESPTWQGEFRPCNPESTRTPGVRAAESGAMFFSR